MKEEVLWYWMRELAGGPGTARSHQLLQAYGTPKGLLERSRGEIESDAALTPAEKRAVLSPDFSKAEEAVRLAEEYGCRVITPESADYPRLLSHIPAPPMILFVQGDIGVVKNRYVIAMVGTRNPNEYGIAAAKKIAGEIGRSGGVVVSGLAMGIDAVCHSACLKAGSQSVAFVAGGLDIDYPARNHELRRMLEKNGAVVSEYPLGMEPHKTHFNVRNRLISGISLATVVVQAKRHSGTLLTAKHAEEQNRDLYAVPGSIFDPMMEGCHALLSETAKPAVSGGDIIADFAAVYGYPIGPASGTEQDGETAPTVPGILTEGQGKIYLELYNRSMTADELSEKTKLPASELLPALTEMEIFGFVRAKPGRVFEAVPYRP